jgi:hypothetical protein
MVKKIERRKYPRIKRGDISVKLSGEGFDTISQSLDVSASGLYCKVSERIPLMSRVQIVLSLPNDKIPSSPIVLKVDGVVVREHSVVKDGRVEHYDLAIFFDALEESKKKKLVRYIENNA